MKNLSKKRQKELVRAIQKHFAKTLEIEDGWLFDIPTGGANFWQEEAFCELEGRRIIEKLKKGKV
jgi:hypothetical protein